MPVLVLGIWGHLKLGKFRMIHGTKAELELGKSEGGKCDHATDKAAHLNHYGPNLPPHGSLVVGKKGRESK